MKSLTELNEHLEPRALTIPEALNAMETERHRARRKFAEFNSRHEAYAVILEELDEAWMEIKANRHLSAHQEMVQVGAMVLRYLTEFAEALPSRDGKAAPR